MTKTKRNLFVALLAVVMAFACLLTANFSFNSAKADTGTQTFVMKGAGIRFDEPTGIRFTATVDATTYQTVTESNDKVFGAIILPNDYLDGIDTITNHVTQLDGIKYNTKEGLLGLPVDGGYEVSYSIAQIQYGNYNRDFYCLIYIKTGEGATATYEYATVVGGNNVRSVSEVAEGYYPNAEVEEKQDLLNFIFKAEYLAANPTNRDGETLANEYTETQITALNNFEKAVAEIPEENVAYIDVLAINTAKTEYAKLGEKAKSLIGNSYQTVLDAENALKNADGRIFGDAGMTASLYTQDTNDGNAKSTVSTSVITKESNTAGQDGYVYAGELGNMIKLSLTKGSNGNWAINAQFDKVLAVMKATGIESVTFYIYSNNAVDVKQIHVGSYWNGFSYETVNPGWKTITYTLEQVESIVAKRNAICSDGTFKNDITTAELWISDFFLNIDDETKVWGSNFGTSKFTKPSWGYGTNYAQATLLDGRLNHKGLGDYVYTGEYGSLVKITVTGAGDMNWALAFPADEVRAAMVAADADYVEMYVYNNSANRPLVDFGGFADLSHFADSYKFASGWNVVQLTLAEIDSMISAGRTWIGHNNVTDTEIWVSDFTLCKIDENSNRVLGELDMISAFQTDSVKDQYNIERNVDGATAQYVSKNMVLKGHDDYTYNGEYGDLIKVSVVKKDKGRWAMEYDFAAAKQALDETGAESVTLYIYDNSEIARTIYVGLYTTTIKFTKGWNMIVFTLEDIENAISFGSMFWSEEGLGDNTTAEYWVSDFFLNMPAA